MIELCWNFKPRDRPSFDYLLLNYLGRVTKHSATLFASDSGNSFSFLTPLVGSYASIGNIPLSLSMSSTKSESAQPHSLDKEQVIAHVSVAIDQ